MAGTGIWGAQVGSNTKIIWKIEEPLCFLKVSRAVTSEHVYICSDRITYDLLITWEYGRSLLLGSIFKTECSFQVSIISHTLLPLHNKKSF